MTTQRSLRRVLAALAAVLALPVLLPPAAASAAVVSVVAQTEALGLPKGARTFPDAAAQGRAGVVLASNGALSATLTVQGADRVAVRARGDQHRGSPRLAVDVDGKRVATFDVTSSGWTWYVARGTWGKGAHTVRLHFLNDLRDSAGDRNLRLDVVALQAQTPPTAYERRVVDLVNAERKKAGLAALRLSPCATEHARAWSSAMASTGTFAHRTDLRAVMGACAARRIGENIAYGNVTADQMVRMWMDSPGHRANILRPEYTHIGVGTTALPSGRVYGTQNFLTL